MDGILRAARSRAVSLDLWGNLIVNGVADFGTAAEPAQILVRFNGITEASFVGGPTTMPLATDPGVWVMGSGRLDLWGSPKLPWARLTGSVSPGATQITLDADPTGWLPGDELVIVPTGDPASDPRHYDRYDYPRVNATSGRTVLLDRPLQYAHPAVTVAPGRVYSAEVLNLTRSVRIEGLPSQRTHIMMMAAAVQRIGYAQLRYLGPQRSAGSEMRGILGRYALHFHRMGDAARGSIVEGVVVRNAGNHAFVAHASHGVTYRNTIAHDVNAEDPYWWDNETQGDQSHDVLYYRAVASRVTTPNRGYLLAGFNMTAGGSRNSVVESVAVGVQGESTSGGFNWPNTGFAFVWNFTQAVSHNNLANGTFIWQNTDVHTVRGYVAYHNGRSGVMHGAYSNNYAWEDSIFYGNGQSAFMSLALPAGSRQQIFRRVRFDGGLLVAEHSLSSSSPVLIEDSVFVQRAMRAGFVAAAPNGTANGTYEIVRPTFVGNEFWLDDRAVDRIIVRFSNGTTLMLRNRSMPGHYYEPRWNASVTRM